MRQIMVANQIYKLQTGDKHLPLLLQSLNKQNASNVSDEPSKPLFTSITSARVKVWIPVWARPAQYFFSTCSQYLFFRLLNFVWWQHLLSPNIRICLEVFETQKNCVSRTQSDTYLECNVEADVIRCLFIPVYWSRSDYLWKVLLLAQLGCSNTKYKIHALKSFRLLMRSTLKPGLGAQTQNTKYVYWNCSDYLRKVFFGRAWVKIYIYTNYKVQNMCTDIILIIVRSTLKL